MARFGVFTVAGAEMTEGIRKTKQHTGKVPEANRSHDSRLYYERRSHANLMVAPNQVNFDKHHAVS